MELTRQSTGEYNKTAVGHKILTATHEPCCWSIYSRDEKKQTSGQEFLVNK